MPDPELVAALAAINHKLDAMLEGIPLLAKAIEVLQRDVRTLRDGMNARVRKPEDMR